MNPFLVPWSWLVHQLERETEWCPPDPGEEEIRKCADDRWSPGRETYRPVLDMMEDARRATYKSGKSKRYRYRPVDLSTRRVLIVLHQTGFEASERWPWWKITAHTVITPKGRRARLHPYETRLVAANRLDRSPWHAISIEVAGNFEGVNGSGRWWSPATQGRGRASEAQLEACRQEIVSICEIADRQGWKVAGCVPHRVSGRNRKGRPDRPLCPGSRVWSECGEWAGAELELAVPGPDFVVGGMAVPPSWRGPWWPECRSYLSVR